MYNNIYNVLHFEAKVIYYELLQLVLEFHPKCGRGRMTCDFSKACSSHTFVLFLKLMQIFCKVTINMAKEKEVNFQIA